MKIGVNVKVDVTKLDKSKFFKGMNGTYADLTVFINLEEEDQYGNHGGVQQAKEKASEEKMPYIGNAKIFWKSEPAGSVVTPGAQQGAGTAQFQDDGDDIPF